MNKRLAPRSIAQPDPVAQLPLENTVKIPVETTCRTCGRTASYGVRLNKSDGKWDVYFCETCGAETRIPVV